MPRSSHGGRHELGQNFLNHQPSINRIVALVADTEGSILDIGAGDGALTCALAPLGRPLTAIDIDEHRVRRLQRRLLDAPRWQHAVLLTQWEVARKRAGVGGGTMMTAQAAPWFEFELHGRIPARFFTPSPSVDGGLLGITRRGSPLVPAGDRRDYERFVRAVFTGAGGALARILQRVSGSTGRAAQEAMDRAGVLPGRLPRDLTPRQWAALWRESGRPSPQRRRQSPGPAP